LESWPINPGDIAVLVVLLISALLAFARGFVREMLSIAGWIGAAFATILGLPHATPYAEQYLGEGLIATLAAGAAIFVVTLIVLSVAGHYLAKLVQGSAMNAVDRSLGFVFGLVRGGVLVVLVWLLFSWLIPTDSRPVWVAEARSLPLLERGADWMRGMVPGDTLDQGTRAADSLREQAEDGIEAADRLRQLQQPQPRAEDGGGETGYDDATRDDMGRLIDETEQ